MRQRVAIARAFVLEPRVLIADEPLANLDLEVRPVVFDAITRRRKELGMGALLVTNDAAFIRELNAETLMLRAGHVVARGVGKDLLWVPNAEADSLGP
jgi:ABC-type glutathione transport system ATPase component